MGTRATIEDAKSLIISCWEDLKKLHKYGIAHGAVSPFNIVFYQGRFVLTEFGKPKARKFSSLVNYWGPISESAYWEDNDSPHWYNNFNSEIKADTVGIMRILRFCLKNEWNGYDWSSLTKVC